MKKKKKTKKTKHIIFSITNHLLIILTSLSSLKQNLVVFLFPVTIYFFTRHRSEKCKLHFSVFILYIEASELLVEFQTSS